MCELRSWIGNSRGVGSQFQCNTQQQCNVILIIHIHANIKELGPERLVQTTQDPSMFSGRIRYDVGPFKCYLCDQRKINERVEVFAKHTADVAPCHLQLSPYRHSMQNWRHTYAYISICPVMSSLTVPKDGPTTLATLCRRPLV
jgi:hypothetical protein